MIISISMSTVELGAGPETTSMAEDWENEVMDITREFRNLMGGIKISSYNGEALEQQEWLDTIQKKLIFKLSDRELVLLVYDAAGGSVSKFIETMYIENMGITWEKVRKRLEERYAGEPAVIENMRSQAKVMQREGESLADLSKRISGLALLAFLKAQMRTDTVVQAQLADCFIGALNNGDG